MIPLLLAGAAGTGVYLLVTAVAFGRRRLRNPRRAGGGHCSYVVRSLVGALPHEIGAPRQFAILLLVPFLLAATAAWVLFGGGLPALVAGVAAAAIPITMMRQRRRRQRTAAQQAWPQMIEEIRMLTSSVGRSIPQALFEVGTAGPVELRPSFENAQREWLISTDFRRTVEVLEQQLDDATADAACETLLVAHELGGTNVDRCLEDLAQDRREDLRYRKDVQARQSGVRFARRFVLVVPLGMALAGLSIGNGRAAYASTTGQVAVAIALLMVAACWIWAGRLMRLPAEERVFGRQ